MSHQAVFERDLKTVGQKRNQDVCVSTMFELVIDRTDAQVAFEGSKCRFDLRELNVPGPENFGIFGGEVGA